MQCLLMPKLWDLQVLLARYSRSEDIVVGTPLANRNQSELEGVIGYFVNTAALRTDLSGAQLGPLGGPGMRYMSAMFGVTD